MSTSPYESVLPIRDDLLDAHRRAMAHWASPGSFWSGAQRLAIVAEVRRARDADELPPWVAPSAVDGLVGPDHVLPAVAIDAVWRLTNHPGTITEEWHGSVIAAGLSHGAYVELVAVVAQANAVDRFADALGVDQMTLTEPVAGGPSGAIAEHATVGSHWVPTAGDGGANVIRALSLLPTENAMRETISTSHYVPPESLLGDLVSDRGALSRVQIELVASRTSMLNECFY